MLSAKQAIETVMDIATAAPKDVETKQAPDTQSALEEADEELPQADASPQSNAYRLRPAFGEMFPIPIVRNIINTVMAEKLKDKTYDQKLASKWTMEIADEVNSQIAANPKVKRYKHVVQVMLAQELGAGNHFVTRTCWDPECDTSVVDVYSNASLFCVCVVFGTYQY